MKNETLWKPSKYEFRNGQLRAARGAGGPMPASRMVTDLLARAFQEHLPKYACGRLLDLGCGAVPLYELYRPLISTVTCVDWGNSSHPNQHLDLEWDLGQPLPFSDQSFDSIVLSDVLEHLADPWLFWREARRLLGPGGHVILSVPFLYWLHEEPHDYFRYSCHALRRMAETHGFTVESLVSLGDALHVATDVLAKAVAEAPQQGWRLATWIQTSAALLRRSRRIRDLLVRSQGSFPLAYLLVARRAAPHDELGDSAKDLPVRPNG